MAFLSSNKLDFQFCLLGNSQNFRPSLIAYIVPQSSVVPKANIKFVIAAFNTSFGDVLARKFFPTSIVVEARYCEHHNTTPQYPCTIDHRKNFCLCSYMDQLLCRDPLQILKRNRMQQPCSIGRSKYKIIPTALMCSSNPQPHSYPRGSYKCVIGSRITDTAPCSKIQIQQVIFLEAIGLCRKTGFGYFAVFMYYPYPAQLHCLTRFVPAHTFFILKSLSTILKVERVW